MTDAKPSKPNAAVPTPFIYLSKEYIHAKEYLEAIFASSSDAICTTDMDGKIIYFSPGAERIFGKSARLVHGMPVETLYASGKDEARLIMRQLLRQGNISDHETVAQTSDGRRVPVSLSASLLRDRQGRVIGTLGISKDISRRVELERKLRELSITDNLTGLFNQRHFLERVAAEVRRARRQRQKLSLLLVDLDNFKKANDLWGHVRGDKILKDAAAILRASIRKGVDEAFRYGGDEFTILLPGSGPRAAARVTARIQAAAAKKSYARLIGLSIGSASLRPGDTPRDLLHRADSEMYSAKRARKA